MSGFFSEADPHCKVIGHSDCVRAVSWSPDGSILASGSDDKTIKLWDAQNGNVNSTLSGHKSIVCSVCFSPSGTKIVGGEGEPWWDWEREEGWDLEREERVKPYGDFSIRIWDATTGAQIGSPFKQTK